MAKLTGMIKAFGLGAGLMYWADPILGRRRRVRTRDRIIHLLRKAREAVQVVAGDAANRIRGTAAAVRSRLAGGTPDDAVLEQQIRSLLGRIVCRPHNVRVVVSGGGHVMLMGKLTVSEADDLVLRVSSMRGVRDVESLLEVPAKEPPRPPQQPAPRLVSGAEAGGRVLAGAAGVAAALAGLKRGGLSGVALTALGLGALGAALSRVSARRLLGVGRDGTIEVRKTIHIHAPPDVVRSFWSHAENFPLFMSRVKDVAIVGPGRTHWRVAGLPGTEMVWTAVVTDSAADHISWESEPGSAIENRGAVTFRPDGSGGTQVDVRMTYRPPAGLAGHALAALCGCDPKAQMNEDLNRMKTFIETGHAPGDAARRAGPQPIVPAESVPRAVSISP